MRSVVYRYDDLPRLREALDASTGQVLPVPPEVAVRDGEWVLALFEFHTSSRATAAAGKGVQLDDGVALVFERRDWERLRHFSAVPRMDALRRTQAWESRPPVTEPSLDEAPTDETAAAVLPAAPPPSPVEQPVRPTKRGEDARVVLVDDDPDLREVVQAMLEVVGLRVTAVGSAEEALQVSRASAPDLMLLDWNLPGMSGLELCKIVRADAQLAHLPVIFLTAHAGTQDMVEAFAVGADDYVVKPFRAAELGARIFGLLRRTRAATAPLP